MPISDDFQRVPLSAITIERDSRQRRAIDTRGLKDSIALRGVYNPIIVTRDLVLCAGERRYTASLELGLPDIPVRFLDELDQIERQIIELEENLKRSDLPWRDTVSAVSIIHNLYEAQSPTWNQRQTGLTLGMDDSTVSVILRVAKELSNPKIAQATSYSSAFNLLSRIDSRKADAALSDLLDVGGDMLGGLGDGAGVPDGKADFSAVGVGLDAAGIGTLTGFDPAALPTALQGGAPYPPIAATAGPILAPRPRTLPPEASILHTSFLSWLPTYTGPKFNFLHCDFPYGINAFAGSQGASGAASTIGMGEGGLGKIQARLYDDNPDVYWALLEAFCSQLDTFMSHSAHIMFWFSMQHYERTLATFRRLAPSLDINPMPLVWVKSDNRGILPDPKRGPRQIYETALFGSREDRQIIKSVSNAYSAPSDKTYHHSTKPEPVLRYFFSMFVDDTTRMLDPTCGSGSALRAAESLGATQVLGLEIDEEHAAAAREALKKFRVLRGS